MTTIDHAATELALSSLEAAGFPGAARMRSNVARGLVGAADQAIKLAATWRHPGLGSAPAAGLDPATPVLDEWLYVTRERLAADTLALMHRLPPTVDAVCAIPRSGLLPGADLAAYLHLPLWECDQHSGAVRRLGHGVRMEGRGGSLPRHVLLVDDTAAYGRAMRAAVPAVREAFPGAEVTRAVVYCHPQAAGAVDVCAAYYPGIHYLSWNWACAGHGAVMATDFDGVLCPDFTREQCADMDAYRAAMAAMPPLYLPRRAPVHTVVTARPESCRDVTLAWLARWGVAVEYLVMWPGDPHPPAEAVAPWKAHHYERSGRTLFVESDPWQAGEIARITGKAVLCPAAGRAFPADPRRPRPSNVADCGDGVFVTEAAQCERARRDFDLSVHIWRPENAADGVTCPTVRDGTGEGLSVVYREGDPLSAMEPGLPEVMGYLRRPGRVLVHCWGGRHRGPTLAVLAKVARGRTPAEAVAEVLAANRAQRAIDEPILPAPLADILAMTPPARPTPSEVMRLQALARECEWRGCKVGCQKTHCLRFNKDIYMSDCVDCVREGR